MKAIQQSCMKDDTFIDLKLKPEDINYFGIGRWNNPPTLSLLEETSLKPDERREYQDLKKEAAEMVKTYGFGDPNNPGIAIGSYHNLAMWIRLYRATQATWKRFRRMVENRRRLQFELETVLLALPDDEAKRQALLQYQTNFVSQTETHPITPAAPPPPATARHHNPDPTPDPGSMPPLTPCPPEGRVSNISEYMSPPSDFKAMLGQHHTSTTPTRSNRSPTSSPSGNITSVDLTVATGDEAHDMESVSGGTTTAVPMNVDTGDPVDRITNELQTLQSVTSSTQGDEYTTVTTRKSKKKAKKSAGRTASISASILSPLGCLQREQQDSSSSSSSPSSNAMDAQSTTSSNKFSALSDPDPDAKPDFQQAETD